jgi:hypothetical protein
VVDTSDVQLLTANAEIGQSLPRGTTGMFCVLTAATLSSHPTSCEMLGPLPRLLVPLEFIFAFTSLTDRIANSHLPPHVA